MAGTDVDGMLREAAKGSGLTMLEIARRSGLGYATIHGFVTSDRTVRLNSVEPLLNALSLEVVVRPAKKGRA